MSSFKFRLISQVLFLVIAGTICAITQPAFASPAYFPTTGSYYQVVATHSSWSDARLAAESQTYLGRQGRLATINSSEEDAFVVSLLNTGDDSFWIGGYQDTSSPTYSEPAGGWRWERAKRKNKAQCRIRGRQRGRVETEIRERPLPPPATRSPHLRWPCG